MCHGVTGTEPPQKNPVADMLLVTRGSGGPGSSKDHENLEQMG